MYGTLRPHHVVSHHIVGYNLYAYLGGNFPFPFILPQAGNVVVGEVLEVTDTQLKQLDLYEGVDRGMYTRERTFAFPADDGPAIEVFVYVGSSSMLPPLVASGDWFDR